MSRVKIFHAMVLSALLALASVAPSWAETVSTTTPRTLGMEEFLRLATERDTEFEEILIDRLFLTYQKTLRLPPRDLVLSVRSQYNFFLDHDRGGAGTAISLAKLFPETGTSVAGTYGVTPSADGSSRRSDASITIAQSVVENAFGRSTRLLGRIVGLEVDIARHQIVEAYEDYLATLIAAYYAWYESYEGLKIGQAAYQANLRLLDNMEARQRSRIALPIDVNKVRLQTLSKQETLISLGEQYRSRLNIIERAIREELGDRTIPAVPPLPETPANYLDAWHEEFTRTGRTYKILDLLEKRSALNVEREAQEVLPSVDVLLGLSAIGDDSGLKQREDRIFTGISLEWPIPDTHARAEREVARIDQRRTELETENIRYRLYTRLRNLALQVDREKELIAIAENKIKLADSVLTAESENYTFGRASLNDYIAAVNALDNSRQEKVTREVRLRQFLLEFRRLTDVLVSEAEVEARLPH